MQHELQKHTNRLGACRVMEERTACSSKSASTHLEECCEGELPWRLVPVLVPRLAVDYSRPVASPAVDAIEISHTAFMLHPLERSLEHVLAIREGNFWVGCLPGASQSGQNGYLWIATVQLAIDFLWRQD